MGNSERSEKSPAIFVSLTAFEDSHRGFFAFLRMTSKDILKSKALLCSLARGNDARTLDPAVNPRGSIRKHRAARHRQLRLVHLQPRPILWPVGRGAARLPQ